VQYRCSHGGRGSGKSFSFAKMAAIWGYAEPLRILCTRDLQISIKESFHAELKAAIESEPWLAAHYNVGVDYLRGDNGTEFLFRGLRNNVSSVKSTEAIKICWVEEAQAVSEDSWKWLLPTIREDNSEVWVTFNPEMTTDPTYLRFVHDPPEGAIVRHVNYWDNPWFPQSLELERLTDKRRLSKEDYECIWEGKPRRAVSGAIYAGEVEAMYQANRVRAVPADPALPVHAIWDMGWADSMAIGMVQRVASEVRVVDYLEDSHQTLDWYVRELRAKPYNWGVDYLPHDAFHKDYKTGKSAEEILKRYGFKVRPVPNTSIEAGIKAARQTLAQSVFDKTKAAPMVDALKRYRRAINSTTQEPGAPLHDDASHGADNYRYIALCAEQMTNEDEGSMAAVARYEALDPEMGY